MTQRGKKNYPHIGRKEKDPDAAFWAELYRSGDTGWDQGAPSPGLVDFLENDLGPGRAVGFQSGRRDRATGEELLDRFSRRFTLVLDRVPRSISRREGKELLMLWRR
jgi:hypothetical protein